MNENCREALTVNFINRENMYKMEEGMYKRA
jgi:hypothetical protein